MPACPARGTPVALPARMRGQATALDALWIFDPLLLLLLGCHPCVVSGSDVGPGAGPCPKLMQGKFFGYFLVATEFRANALCCSWTLCNLDPRRYKLYMKLPGCLPAAAPPASASTSWNPWSPCLATWDWRAVMRC